MIRCTKLMRGKLILISGMLLWMLFLLFLCLGNKTYAGEKRNVKVAFFPMDGYHITNEDGSLSGMDVEYLNALCAYTDWEIEYVKCDSWNEALYLLDSKQVDLVGSAQYSSQRAETYLYAELSSGYTFGVIATNPDSSIAYEDFTAMKNIRFGMVKDYVRKDEFLQYLQDNGIENPSIVEYESTADLQNALSQGKIDALVHTFTEIRQGQRLIGRFAPRPFYYITYQGNDEVMNELNQAVTDLKMNQPELETNLMNEFYYSKFDKTTLLTTEESDYIKEKKKIKIGYLDGFYPFSYQKDGKFCGLTQRLLENSICDVGLEPTYRRMESRRKALLALKNGEIDILAYCTNTKTELDSYDLDKVCEYAEVPVVLVTAKNQDISKIKNLATVSFLKDKIDTSLHTAKTKVITYDTQQQCINALKEKEVDAVLCDGYLAEYLMRTQLRYDTLQITNVFSSEYPISMAVRKSDKLLVGILEKTVSFIDSKNINTYMLKENTYPLINVVDFIRNHSFVIICILVVIIISVTGVAVQMIKNSRKIQQLMYKDTKIDIWNINYLIYRGEHKLLTESKFRYAVVYINLEQFRRYNVIYGWNAGERILEGVADILLKNTSHETEICARDQGDRFVMLLNYSDKESFLCRLQEIAQHIEQWIFGTTENHMSVKMGVYFIPKLQNDLRLGMNCANQALEFTGNSKDEDIRTYDEGLENIIKERHEREKLLDSVDINKDFVAYYQPKVDIRNGKIVGAEALVRFLDPTDGGAVKAPGFFVPYYEQIGRITEVDFFVFESVCKMLRRRLDQGLPVVTISCNFSRLHFIKSDFPEHFMGILQRYEIPKELIEIEITETLVMEELQKHMVKKTLDILKENGIQLSIDDFGAGYSSLGVIEQIPASVIKLDRSFLLNQDNYMRQVKIMRGIVKMTEDLEAQIVCEGVETEKDVNLMKEIGAYVAQGYFYSRPIPETDFEKSL